MSSHRASKRQRKFVVSSSSSDQEGNCGNEHDEQIGKGEERYDDEYVEPERKGAIQLGGRMKRGLKRKINPSVNGSVAFPLNAEASTAPATATATATHKLNTAALPTRPSRKPKQAPKRTVKRSSPQQTRLSQPRSLHTTPGSSPEKKRGKATNRLQEEPSKSLHSFFSKATEEERWSRKDNGSGLSTGVGSSITEEMDMVEEIEDDDEVEEIEDFIEDDSYEELFTRHVLSRSNGDRELWQTEAGSQLDRRKEEDNKGAKRSNRTKPVGKPGKRFLLPESSAKETLSGPRELRSSNKHPTQGFRPWAEEYAPANLDELVVNKRKVLDVQKWLVDRVLVLRGPAGSGKSTTISLLSQALGFEVIEWKNPLGAEFSSQGYVSMGGQFEDFLGRSDKFGSLSLSGGGPQLRQPVANGKAHSSSSNTDEKRRAILIEEFPSSLSQSSSGLQAFRLAIQSYLATATPRQSTNGLLTRDTTISSPPLIIIVSETTLGSGSVSSDSFTVHRLLGPELSNHPGLSIIDFNRIAPTFMAKAIDLVLKKEARRSNRRRVPGQEILKAFANMGDVRSAISALEFMCLRGDDDTAWSGTVAGRMRRSSKGGVPLTTMEKESLEIVTQRETSLGIFHAVGKVVYNKRENSAISESVDVPPPQPPAHLQHHARLNTSTISIDDLINETGTDLQTFIAALHENYLLSCAGPSFTEHFENCISNLSETDILGLDSRFHNVQASRGVVGSARSSYQAYGSSIDMLRQDEISFQVAVRGLLFSLPSPVKRQAPPGARAGDAHKMFFPTSMRLWRQTEELDGLLNLWMRRLTYPTMDIATGTTIPRSDGVESWKNHRWMPGSFSHEPDYEPTTASPVTRTMISRDEILLERLPYLSLISQNLTERRELEKITQFRGVGGQSEEEPIDAELEGMPYGGGSTMEPWSGPTDKDVLSPLKRSQEYKLGQASLRKPLGPQLVLPVQEAVEKLVLSDDDIEDDD
ncbi:hypothetical protein AJ78_00279 [Emergomyces pasteurianus Ep9510]|uniref:Checkpoint protein RAD24-like helical bundle domain-containing protein n=1 Tax=Emergomyces pasteurianus Ep9510 TaxID=1447872 RepID=A0A1J9QV96_9EURO|nr:hypothetical protein AJ78_00279 [Emergomyces pasteurianus Ep9510]